MVSDHRAMMFTILAMIDASGKIFGGPWMATFYSLGIDADGRSAGWCVQATSVSHSSRISKFILRNSIGFVWDCTSDILWNQAE